MKKIFLDIYLARNLGDDLFLDIFAKKFKDHEITVYYPGDDYNAFFRNYKNLQGFKYNAFYKILRKLKVYDKLTDYKSIAKEFDVLCFLGGGIFREESYEQSLFDYRMSIVKEFNNLNKPAFFLSCNFGPYKTQAFINKHAELFKKCTDVCFRDKESYNIFKKLTNVRYAPDIVWSLPIKENSRPLSVKNIGISVIDPTHKPGLENQYADYVSAHVKSIRNYIAANNNIVLFSFCAQEGDVKVIQDIKDQLDTNEGLRLSVVDYSGNINEAIDQIKNLSLMIASRFHAIILSLLFKIPVLPVIYGIKSANLLNDINFNNKYADFDSLINIIESVDLEKYHYQLPSYLTDQAEDQFKILLEVLS